MSLTILVDPFLQFFDANGNPLALGSLETYAAGTSTPLATYADVDGNTSNPTTIVLNSAGRPAVSGNIVAIFLAAKAYKFILKNAAGTTIDTKDNIVAYQGASGTNTDIEGTVGETVTLGQVLYLSDGSGALNAGQWYKADADTTYSSTTPLVGLAVAGITSGATGQIRILGAMDGLSGLTAGSSYYISATAGSITATAPTKRRFVGVATSTTRLIIAPSDPQDALFPLNVCEGRLTLTTLVPVTTADVTAATSIFFTPLDGSRIALYDGSSWNLRAFTEITIALGTLTSGLMYDLFAYDNNGTVAFDSPVAWTNNTTRATALVRQNGVLSKTGALTRRFIGSFYTTSTTTTEDSFAKRFLWNYYNQSEKILRVLEATNSWTYATATWRQANAAAANQIDLVCGWAGKPLFAEVHILATATSTAVSFYTGIGEDSTTVVAVGCLMPNSQNIPNANGIDANAELLVYPAVGRHYYAWMEYASTTTVTFYGDNNVPLLTQAGIQGLWAC